MNGGGLQTCLEFEEANPLPDLGDILLSNDNFCDVDLTGTQPRQSHTGTCADNFPGRSVVCQTVSSCNIGTYTALLDSNHCQVSYSEVGSESRLATNDVTYQSIPKSPDMFISKKTHIHAVKDVNLNEASDSAAEEEFLYQLNLSKCDKFTSSIVSSSKPNTRNLAKLKCAKLNGAKVNIRKTSDKGVKKKRVTLQEKISRVKDANQEQERALRSMTDRSRLKHIKSTHLSVNNSSRVRSNLARTSKNVGRKSPSAVTGMCRLCHHAYSCKEDREKHLNDPSHIIKTEARKGTNVQVLNDESKIFKNIKMPAKCRQCPECFVKLRDFLVHHRRHSQTKPYHCVRCFAAFYRRCDLLSHLRNHLGIKNFSCKECDKSFNKQSQLTSHLITKHGHDDVRPRNYNCTECNQGFISKHAVDQHMHSHTGYNTVTCSICGRGFRSNFALEAHCRVHSGETPFKCDQCPYSSKTKQLLQRHQRSHTGSKPHKCSLCPYMSSSTAGLKRHSLLHSGSKPFKCPYCEYRSSNIENLRKHIKRTRKHLGLKIYPCLHCGFSCDDSVEYIRHVKQQHFPYLNEDSSSATKLSGILIADTTHHHQVHQVEACDIIQSDVCDVMHTDSCDLVQPDPSMTSSVMTSAQPSNNVDMPPDTTAIEMLILSDANDLFTTSADAQSSDPNDNLRMASLAGLNPSSSNKLDESVATTLNGLNEVVLNALIKIPNLQKVILPQGDGNAPVTLVIGGDQNPSDDVILDGCQSRIEFTGQRDGAEFQQQQQSCFTNTFDAQVSSSGQQHYIISSAGIQSYRKY